MSRSTISIAAIMAIILGALVAGPARAQTTWYWKGDGASDNIDQNGNWHAAGNPSSGDHLHFNNTSGARHWPYSNYAGGSWFGNIITYNGAGGIRWRGDDTEAYKFENNNDSNVFEIEANVTNRLGNDLQLNPVGSGGVHVMNNVGLGGSNWIQVHGGNTLTIDGVISGNGGININNTGVDPTVILNGNNTYANQTLVNDGILQVGHNNALGATAGNTVVADNAKLYVDGSGGDLTIAEPVTIGSGSGGINNRGGNNTLSGAVTLSNNIDLRRSAGTLTFTGGISGANKGFGINLPVTITNNPVSIGSGVFGVTSGETMLGVAGNDWGLTRLNFSGSVKLGVDSALPSDTNIEFGWHTVGSSTATLDLNGHDQTIRSLHWPSSQPTWVHPGADRSVTDSSGAGTLTINLDSGTKTHLGNIEGGLSLVKEGAGTQILSNVNATASSYTGSTTVNGGVLHAATADALGNTSAVTVGGSGTLRLPGNSIAIGSLAGAGTVENAGAGATLLGDDFSSDSTPPDQWRAYESRLDTGWNATRSGATFSEWNIVGGRLENPDVAGHYIEGEAPAWQWWSNPEVASRSTTLTISFDYSTDGADIVTAHFWAVQTGGVSGTENFISNIEGWNNGNSGQNQDTTSGNYDTFNLLDGDTTPDNIDHITGQLNGSGTFTMTIDVSALGIPGVTTVGDIDTLFLAFAADESGGGTTWVDNLSIVAAETTLAMGSDNTSPTFSGTLQDGAGGPLGIAKVGTGTQTLSGTNTYTGGTSVDAGTLTIGGAGQLGSGSYAGVIRNDGSLSFESSASHTLSGVISGAGDITFDPPTGEAATLTLSNATNSFSGGVTVVGEGVSPGVFLDIAAEGAAGTGTLNPDGWGAYFRNASGGTLTVANPFTADAFFRINSVSEMHLTGTMTAVGNPIISCNDGALYFDGKITGSGSFNLWGVGTRYLTNDANDFTGKIYAQNGGPTYLSSIGNKGAASAAGAGTQISLGYGGYMIYNGAAGATSDKDFDLTGGANGNRLSVTNTGYLRLIGGTFIHASNGAKTQYFGGDNTGGYNEIDHDLIDSAGDGSALSIVKDGSSTWRFSGDSAYTGNTTVDSGVLQMGHNNALGATANGTVVTSGGALDTAGFDPPAGESFTLNGAGTDGVGGNGALFASASGTVIGSTTTLGSDAEIGGPQRIDWNGQISDGANAYTLTKTGSGFMGLWNGSADYENLVVMQGHCSIRDLSHGTVTVTNSGSVLGTWSATTLGTGDIVFHDGTTFENAVSTSASASMDGTMTLNGAVSFRNWNITSTVSSDIGGTGSLTLKQHSAANGKWILAGENTYTGDTTIQDITTQISGAGYLGGGSYAGSITLSSELQYSSSADQTLSGVISGGGDLVKDTSSSSTLSLSGANTYNGDTTVSAGTLSLGAGGTDGSINTASAISLGSGATFAVNHSDTVTQGTEFSGAGFAAAGAFAQNGSGTTILNAANTFGGTVAVNAGTLQVASSGSVDVSNHVTVAAGSTLDLEGDLDMGGNVRLDVASTGVVDIDGGTVWRDLNEGHMDVGKSGGTIQVRNGGALLLTNTVEYVANKTVVLGGGSTLELQGSSTVNVHAQFSIRGGSTLKVSGTGADITIGWLGSDAVAGNELVFDLGAAGVSTINVVGGWCSLSQLALNVDGSGYTGGDKTVVLIDAASLHSVSPTENITGFDAKYDVSIEQDQTAHEVRLVIWDTTPVGTVFRFK